MKMKGTFKYLGIESFPSKEPNKINQFLCLLQSTDVTKVFLKTEDVAKLLGINLEEIVDVDLDIKISQSKSFVSLIEIKKTVTKAA